jgi:hypothetical protein
MGDGRIRALRRRQRPILAVKVQDAPSTHFLEIRIFREVGVTFANATLDRS